MKQVLVTSIRDLVVLTLITGFLYPLVVWGFGSFLFPLQAKGSWVEKSGVIVGSSLIGQNFHGLSYFHGRPSATAGSAYNAMASGGSNYAQSNPAQRDSMETRRMRICVQNECGTTKIPEELLQASASGLDPEISVAAALFQVKRIAMARGIQESRLVRMIQENTSYPMWGIFGTDRVNVLQLNLLLDAIP